MYSFEYIVVFCVIFKKIYATHTNFTILFAFDGLRYDFVSIEHMPNLYARLSGVMLSPDTDL
jgi:hypothetical protein